MAELQQSQSPVPSGPNESGSKTPHRSGLASPNNVEVHRLLAELEAANNRVAESAERVRELSGINSSLRESIIAVSQSADFDESLAEVVLRISRAADASVAFLFTYNAEDNTLCTEFWIQDDVVHWGPDPTSPPILQKPFDADITPAFRLCLAHRKVFYVDLNSMDEETRAGAWPSLIEWHLANGRPTACAIPVVAGQTPLGVIGLGWHTERSFSAEDQDMLLALSNHVALVMQLRGMERTSRSNARVTERQKFAEERALEQAAVSREREAEANDRAAEANRISNFLNKTIGQMSAGGDLRITIESILAGLATEIGASHVFLFRHDAATCLIHLELSWIDGRIRHGVSGDELALWAAPFPDDLTPGWELMVKERQLFTPDMIPIPPEQFAWPGTFEYAARSNLSDMGHIILFAGDEPVGSIGFSLTDGRKLRPSDKPFIEGVAKQAALAIRMLDLAERAKLAAIAETSQKAAQDRATELIKANEALQATADAIATLRNLEEIVPAILQIIARTFQGPSAAYYEIGDDSTIYLRYYINEAKVISGAELLAGDGAPPYDLPKLLAAGFKVSRDYSAADDYRKLKTRVIDHRLGTSEPMFDEWRRKHNREMELNIPIMMGGEPLGVLTLSREAERPYTDTEIELAEAVVKQLCLAVQASRIASDSRQQAVAIAIAREREQAAKDRADELAAVNRTLTASLKSIADQSNTFSAPPVFLVNIAKASSAELCYWLDYSLENDQFALSLRCVDGQIVNEPIPDEPRLFSAPFPASLVASWIQAPADGGFDVLSVERDADRLWPDTAEWHRRSGRKEVLCIAVRLGDRLIGMLGMAFREETHWSPARVELIRSLANHLALSVHLSRLSEQASRGAAAEERTRLAREIHDTLAQGFSGILVQLRAMQQAEASQHLDERAVHFENALELANLGLAEARRSLASLRLRELEGRSFREALTLMAESATKRGGIPVRVLAGLDLEVGPENEAELLRIAQESVTNAIKHSGASRITIALRQGLGTVDMCVEDNGKGFDSGKTTEGFGLLGMQERAAKIGASMTIESSETGTSVCVHLKSGGGDAEFKV